MTLGRRHRVLLVAMVSAIASVPLMGADCLGTGDNPDAGPSARADCEAVCDAESQCGRDKNACLAALCDDNGFKTVDTGANASDLSTISSNDCEKSAANCGDLVKCSCPDACAREEQCTGNSDATCVDTCDNVIQNDPNLYEENRCKIESTCADLAACGSSSSGQ